MKDGMNTTATRSVFTRSRINDYVPPRVSDGVSGFKVDAEMLADLMNSEKVELQNLIVQSDEFGKAFFVKADNNAGNKYLSDLTRVHDPIQMDAKTLERVLESENPILKNTNIEVNMVDKDHESFEDRPYSVFTSNKRAYSLIRAIAVDVSTPYEGDIVREADGALVVPATKQVANNVVQFPKETTKTKFGGLKLLARAAAFVGAMVLPWGGGAEKQQTFVMRTASLSPVFSAGQPVMNIDAGQSVEAQTAIHALPELIAAHILSETSFTRPAIVNPVSVKHAPAAPLKDFFQANGEVAAPVIVTASIAPVPSAPEIYVTQKGDTLWGIVDREFGAGGLDRGGDNANMLARLDQYVQANPSLAYQPGMLSSEFALTVPTADATRADCRWNRTRNVCQLSL